MKWSLLELKKYQDNPCTFDELLDIKESLMNRDSLILDVGPVNVKGQLIVNKEEYILHYRINASIVVPSSRSLTPVSLSLNIAVDEVFMTLEQYQNRSDRFSEDEVILLEKPSIDLDISVEDNILLYIPIQVLTEDEKQSSELPKGNDWEVLSEEDYLLKKQETSQKQIDPRLAKLTELLHHDEQEDNE